MARTKGYQTRKRLRSRGEVEASIAAAKKELDTLNSEFASTNKTITDLKAKVKELKRKVRAKERLVEKLEAERAAIITDEEAAGKKKEIDDTVAQLISKGVSAADILKAINSIS